MLIPVHSVLACKLSILSIREQISKLEKDLEQAAAEVARKDTPENMSVSSIKDNDEKVFNG